GDEAVADQQGLGVDPRAGGGGAAADAAGRLDPRAADGDSGQGSRGRRLGRLRPRGIGGCGVVKEPELRLTLAPERIGRRHMTDDLLWHRIQFAFTVTYHYLFPQLTMGLALVIVILKVAALRKGDER